MPTNQQSRWAEHAQSFSAQPAWMKASLVAMAMLVWFSAAGLLVLLVTPFGAIAAAMAWMLALTLLAIGIATSARKGKWWVNLLWRPNQGAARRDQRVRVASFVLLAGGSLASVALLHFFDRPMEPAAPTVQEHGVAPSKPLAQAKWCFVLPTMIEDSRRLKRNALSSLQSHGRKSSEKAPACREARLVGPTAFVPILLALVVVAGLRSGKRELAREDSEREDEIRREAFARQQQSLDRSTITDRDLPGNRAEFSAQSASSSTPVAAPSSRSIPVRPVIRPTAKRRASVDLIARFFARAPVLAVALSVYLAGWVLALFGSSAPDEIALQLSPAWLTFRFQGWAVLGVWFSLLAGAAFGLLVFILRRR